MVEPTGTTWVRREPDPCDAPAQSPARAGARGRAPAAAARGVANLGTSSSVPGNMVGLATSRRESLPAQQLRTYDIARNQGPITTRNGNNSRTKRLLGKSHIEVFRN
jgi:hypothetical protein